MKVIRRNGEVVPFNPDKIRAALEAAFSAAKQTTEWLDDIVNSVETVLRLRTTRLRLRTTRPDAGFTLTDVIAQIKVELESHGLQNVWAEYKSFSEKRAHARELRPVMSSAIADYALHSKYAKSGEGWMSVVHRSESMHVRRFPDHGEEICELFNQVRAKKVLPSMRSLQFGGAAIEANHARLYNCSFTPIVDVASFRDLFFLLLSGCGVGYSVQSCHVKDLLFVAPTWDHVIHHRVEDTIEGWAEALYQLILGAVSGCYKEFDYSDIRDRGSELRTTGGKAPGHVPLKTALEKIRLILDGARGRQLSSFEVHRICCFAAEAVLSGGIRRASLICLFDEWDNEMFYCKANDRWLTEFPELAMANNSVVNPKDMKSVLRACRRFGEPAFARLHDNYRYGLNPCGEIYLRGISDVGTPVVGFCNLTEVNCATLESEADFYERCRVAAMIGVIQASYTDFPLLGKWTEANARDEALIGPSLTGVFDCPIELTEDMLATAADEATLAAVRMAEQLGINPPKRVTTIKPSGTASLLLGGVSSGIHPQHAKYYFRRITANPLEPAFLAFKNANPHMCEEKPNGDWVIIFPMRAPEGAITKDKVSAANFIETIERFRRGWINGGRENPPANRVHNISCTVDVKDDEWDDLVVPDQAKAMSFMSDVGDIAYPFAPLQRVRSASDFQYWLSLAEGYVDPDYTGVGAVDHGSACEGPSCEI